MWFGTRTAKRFVRDKRGVGESGSRGVGESGSRAPRMYVMLWETNVSDRMWKDLGEDLYARTYWRCCARHERICATGMSVFVDTDEGARRRGS